MDRSQTMHVFLSVVDEGSFTAAARQLDMSVPSVTRSVADLEVHVDSNVIPNLGSYDTALGLGCAAPFDGRGDGRHHGLFLGAGASPWGLAIHSATREAWGIEKSSGGDGPPEGDCCFIC